MFDFLGNDYTVEISHLLTSSEQALVAQWIERCPPEAEVAGSNPAECANDFNYLAYSRPWAMVPS